MHKIRKYIHRNLIFIFMLNFLFLSKNLNRSGRINSNFQISKIHMKTYFFPTFLHMNIQSCSCNENGKLETY
jgi:hypothetical protein